MRLDIGRGVGGIVALGGVVCNGTASKSKGLLIASFRPGINWPDGGVRERGFAFRLD